VYCHPSSHPLTLDVAHVVVPAVVLVVAPVETQRPLFPYSFPCPFLLLLSLMLQELLVEDLVLPGEFLKVGSEISYLFLHRSHLWRLATGGKRLSVNFHRSRPDHAVLLYRCDEKQRCAFPTDGAN
jgi:hypothetical protein